MPKASPAATKPPAEQPVQDTLADEPDGEGGHPERKPGKIDRPKAQAVEDFDNMGSMEDGEEYLKVLWWGKEGSAKTTDMATAANRGKILVVNAEGGFKKKPLTELGIDISNIVLWPDPKSGVEITYESMDELYWRIRAKLLADPGYFFAIGWDSSSDIYTRFVGNVREAEYERNKNLPIQKQKEFRQNRFNTDRADYGVATDQMRELLRRYRDLPCHFMVTALERRDIDEETSKVAYGPGVGPAFQKDLLGYLDVVINTKASTLQVGPDEETDVVDSFRGLTRSNGKSRAKDRLKSVPRVMAQPTFERILEYVEDRITETTDPVQKEWLEAKAIDLEWAEGGPKTDTAADGGGEIGGEDVPE